MAMHTVWIVVGVLVALIILFVLIRMKACGDCCNCCGDCECCCECGDCDCCTITSLPMFVLGTTLLWGGGLVALGWLVISAIRS